MGATPEQVRRAVFWISWFSTLVFLFLWVMGGWH